MMSDTVKTTEKGEAAREASEKLKEILFGGEFAKGDKLPSECKLSERLGIGRSTLREALKLLSASGYITLIPNRGAFAKIVDANELPSMPNDVAEWLCDNGNAVEEMIEGRLCIEPSAAMLCAKNITADSLDRLTDLMNRFQQAYDGKKTDELAGLDFEFHKMILNCSGNSLLSATCETLLRCFLQYSSQSNVSDIRKTTVIEHTLIYEAIKAHAPEEAYTAMELHLRIAARRIRETKK